MGGRVSYNNAVIVRFSSIRSFGWDWNHKKVEFLSLEILFLYKITLYMMFKHFNERENFFRLKKLYDCKLTAKCVLIKHLFVFYDFFHLSKKNGQ